uniref:UBR-type domain-containing protein n=1 Tax=Trichobilharzia regenti TaxID=157069 RepID=A0AA85JJQ8_TRIRE|nr:unnamed protein product [Trichobilharzia regenti]
MDSDGEEDAVVEIGNILEDVDDETLMVLGGIDDKSVCTFTRGYVKRQGLYTCRTCLDINEVKAGICYPCSLECHAGHDVVELYTKRNFRCDCGNAKFRGAHGCLLWEEKDDENILNHYGENFSNRYCSCLRPYPDPDNGNVEMIQCGICEDWYHLEHLNMDPEFKVPEDYDEMTCFMCIQKYTFLFVEAYNTVDAFRQNCQVVINNGHIDNAETNYVPGLKKFKKSESEETADSKDNANCRLLTWADTMDWLTPEFRYSSLEFLGTECKRIPSVFWNGGWRESLCRCEECKKMYQHFKLEFLLDPEDTITAYMELGKQKAKSIAEEEKRALNEVLSECPHQVAVNFATGYARLKSALEEFLTKKRDECHVVTAEEVNAFFEDFRKRNSL